MVGGKVDGLKRREWMCSAVGLLAGYVALPSGSGAAEPAAARQSKFKYSLAAYSYRNLLQGPTPALTLNQFVDDCAQFQLEGVELTSYYFPADVSDETLRQVRRHCFRLGLDISGTAIGNDFGWPAGAQRQEQLELTRRWIERAAVLGAPVIRIFAGHAHDGHSAEETHSWIVEGIAQSCEYAGQHGIHLALENHGGPTATADGLLAIARDVDSPWFGINLDTGNFVGADPYGQIAAVAPHAINVQVKVAISDGQAGQTATDFVRLGKILQEAQYRGYVVLEFEEAGDPRTECPRYLQRLRDGFASP